MRIIISDIDMGGKKTFMVSREYLARLVIMLENGTPLPESQLIPHAVDVCAACRYLESCPGEVLAPTEWSCAKRTRN